jgi:DNA-binding transcriptional regulator YhcF (GntR family)
MDLPLQLDKHSGMPLYLQMEQQIRLLIHRGVLKPGDLMPTVRALAVALEINSNTVARVYRDLEHSGLLVLKRGIGTFVADDAPTRPWKPADLQAFEQKVAELVETARHYRISGVELLQLVEARWKEISHADG